EASAGPPPASEHAVKRRKRNSHGRGEGWNEIRCDRQCPRPRPWLSSFQGQWWGRGWTERGVPSRRFRRRSAIGVLRGLRKVPWRYLAMERSRVGGSGYQRAFYKGFLQYRLLSRFDDKGETAPR